MEQLLGLSRQNFSAGSFLQRRDRVCFQHDETPAEWKWPDSSYWIIGRELLIFVYSDLRAIPKGQRHKVVDRKVQQSSPFTETGHYSHDVDGLVMIWLWDEAQRMDAVRAAIDEYSVLSSHILELTVLPETLLLTRGANEQITRACSIGSDTQRWQEGVLVSSLWVPDVSQEAHEFMETPWSLNTEAFFHSHESLIWRFGLLVLCLTLTFQLGSVLGNLYFDDLLETRLANARERVAILGQIRGQTLQIHQQNTRLMERAALPGQLGLLSEFDRLLPASALFLDWDYQDSRLTVVIEDEELSNRRYLEALAGSTQFSDVQVVPGTRSGTAKITLEVVDQ